MRGALILLLAACGSRDEAPKRVVDRATLMETELAGAAWEKSVASVMKDPPESIEWQRKPLKFPVEPVVERCGSEMVRAIYNPYRDLLVLGVAADDTAGEDMRTLWLDEKKVWSNPRKASSGATDFGGGLTLIMDKPIADAIKDNSELFENLSTTYVKWFPPDKDVSHQLRITTQANAKVGASGVRVEKREHRDWTLSMHPFSQAMRDDIIAHGKKIDRATAELFVLERYRSDVIEMAHYKSDAKIAPALALHAKLTAAADGALAEAKVIPHAKHVVTLVHAGTCETTASK